MLRSSGLLEEQYACHYYWVESRLYIFPISKCNVSYRRLISVYPDLCSGIKIFLMLSEEKARKHEMFVLRVHLPPRSLKYFIFFIRITTFSVRIICYDLPVTSVFRCSHYLDIRSGLL